MRNFCLSSTSRLLFFPNPRLFLQNRVPGMGWNLICMHLNDAWIIYTWLEEGNQKISAKRENGPKNTICFLQVKTNSTLCYLWATSHYAIFGSIHSLEPSINYRHIKMPHMTLWKGLYKKKKKLKNVKLLTHNTNVIFWWKKKNLYLHGSYFYTCTLTCIYPRFRLSRVSTVLLISYERAWCYLSAGGAVKAFRVKALLNPDWFFH